ncbi:MAG: bifunctional DNA-formamidopyrimidine glycosylase/DNA-(apurinic or apyrimidinic site) lyase [Candidatus Falkowbacteria bacterium]
MPELPEVETIRKDLFRKILNKKIKDVAIKKPRLVKSGAIKFKKELIGNVFKKINRRGKLLYIKLQTGKFLLIHLKMTGQLIYQKGRQVIAGGHGQPKIDELPNKFSHIIFTFNDNSQLFFNDMRQFGYMKIIDKDELEKVLADYGAEPLDKEFTLVRFREILHGKKISIKQLLLNQKFIAGIGNIYADEICFYAKVKPSRAIFSLSESEIKKLYQGCKKIIKQAIAKRGTTFNNYRDANGNKGSFIKFLKVYGRAGEVCKRCQPKAGAPRAHKTGVIKKIKQGGRGTHYCNKCQE